MVSTRIARKNTIAFLEASKRHYYSAVCYFALNYSNESTICIDTHNQPIPSTDSRGILPRVCMVNQEQLEAAIHNHSGDVYFRNHYTEACMSKDHIRLNSLCPNTIINLGFLCHNTCVARSKHPKLRVTTTQCRYITNDSTLYSQ